MVWILKYAPQDYPERVKIVPRTYATKEEALASIPNREHIRNIESAFGDRKNYTGPVVWIVEPLEIIDSAELAGRMKLMIENPPRFAS